MSNATTANMELDKVTLKTLSDAGMTAKLQRRSTKQKRADGHSIYLLRLNDSCGPLKIGLSNYVSRRLREMSVENPYSITLLKVCRFDRREIAYEYEVGAHQKFKPFNIKGEWFDSDALPSIIKYFDWAQERCDFMPFQSNSKPPVALAHLIRASK